MKHGVNTRPTTNQRTNRIDHNNLLISQLALHRLAKARCSHCEPSTATDASHAAPPGRPARAGPPAAQAEAAQGPARRAPRRALGRLLRAAGWPLLQGPALAAARAARADAGRRPGGPVPPPGAARERRRGGGPERRVPGRARARGLRRRGPRGGLRLRRGGLPAAAGEPGPVPAVRGLQRGGDRHPEGEARVRGAAPVAGAPLPRLGGGRRRRGGRRGLGGVRGARVRSRPVWKSNFGRPTLDGVSFQTTDATSSP